MALIHPLTMREVRALKLTRVMRQAVLGASGPFGRLWGDGNRRDKTFPALAARGVAEYAEIEESASLPGWHLTELGLRVRCTLRGNIRPVKTEGIDG